MKVIILNLCSLVLVSIILYISSCTKTATDTRVYTDTVTKTVTVYDTIGVIEKSITGTWMVTYTDTVYGEFGSINLAIYPDGSLTYQGKGSAITNNQPFYASGTWSLKGRVFTSLATIIYSPSKISGDIQSSFATYDSIWVNSVGNEILVGNITDSTQKFTWPFVANK